jgi:hypothetical protein
MLEWVEHEVLKPPTTEEIALMEPDTLIRLHEAYHQAIVNAENDPLKYGYALEPWTEADKVLADYDECMILGGNRSSKSIFGARTVVKAAIENPNSIIFCFCQNQETSDRQMQNWVYSWLPAELRKTLKTSGAYVSYSFKNGFTGDSLILPNGSQIIFKHYSQFLNNDTILEGAELGCKHPTWYNIGAWCDEYLLGPELIDTLRFRLATRNSKLLVTFTPIHGHTEVVRDYLAGATTLKRSYAELLNPPRDVQYVQKCNTHNAGIVYFHSIKNPFGGYARIASDLKTRTEAEILVRAYGIPTKSATTQFPKFSTDVNVIDSDKIPTKDVTRYCILDPAGKKNWFFLWVAVDATDTWYVYREWPGIEYGDWGEWKNGKWKPGPAAKGLGYGIRDYVGLIKELEGDEEIYERIIDPRFGAATYQAKEGSSNIIQDLDEEDMVFTPAPGIHEDDGLQLINEKLSYDTEKPTSSLNRTHLYISEECEQLIKALAEYTGEGGKTEAYKDPIDVLRYAAVSGIDHVPLQGATVRKSGGY